MYQPIIVNYQATSSVYTANQWLHELSTKDIIACDFEAAVKYSKAELNTLHSLLDTDLPRLERIRIESILNATALDHPSHCTLTHCSIATSESDSYVFIFDNQRILRRVLNFLTTTNVKQIWHNASYDFKHIQFNTGQMPRNYEDSAILAKCILNHCDKTKATVGLKELAGKWYGEWAISPDNFDLSQMHDPKVLLYAATDSCATFKLYHSIRTYIETTKVTNVISN